MPNISPQRVLATTENGVAVIRLKSFDSDCWFRIDLAAKTCECRQFQISGRCDHLSALGIHPLKPFSPSTHPTFSQALSALVKSIRIRRIEDAVYWLLYLDSFKERQHRFRTARRLLIGSAEDGHSIPVMEEIARRFRTTCKPETELLCLIADAARICKLPCWWHPGSGGHDYLYQSLIGQRTWRYKRWNHKLATLQTEIRQAIAEQNRANALGGVMAFAELPERFGATKQAEFLLAEAEKTGHELAAGLCRVHLSARTALSADNNFFCQAAWMLAGGVSPSAEKIEPVAEEECRELLEQARTRWRNPQPIPRWCLDGVHSAGDDPRFMGCLPEMWAVCRAYQTYKRIDPADEWLPSFQCWDGLVVESETTNGERE